MPVEVVPELNAAATKLATLLAGGSTDPHVLGIARRIASAQVDIERARLTKVRLIETFKPRHPAFGGSSAKAPEIAPKIDRTG